MLAGPEKLHEMLYTADESRRVYDVEGCFVLQPERSDDPPPPPPGGKPVADGVAYTSDTNDWWLTADDLRAVLAKAGV